MRVRIFETACLTALICSRAFGQSGDGRPSFEVASVKPVASNVDFMIRGGPGTSDPGLIRYTGVTLTEVILIAHQVKRYQIEGPGWLDTNRFDIVAKVPWGATREQFRLMLQNLLAERFQLSLHHELKEFAIFALVVGKRGPKMKETEPDSPQVSAAWDGRKVPRVQMVNGHVRVTGNRQTMPGLATILENSVHRPVVDRTELKGSYDFVLEFAAERPLARVPVDEFIPDIFSAVQQQLGLSLQATKGQLDVLVTDRVEKTPSAN